MNFAVSKLYISFFFTRSDLTPVTLGLPNTKGNFHSLTFDSPLVVQKGTRHREQRPGQATRTPTPAPYYTGESPCPPRSCWLPAGKIGPPLPGLLPAEGCPGGGLLPSRTPGDTPQARFSHHLTCTAPPSLAVQFRGNSPCRLPRPDSVQVLSGQGLSVGSPPRPARASGDRAPSLPLSPPSPLLPVPAGGAAPTEVEAFVLVLGVEEEPLGVGVDVGAGRDEHRSDVALPPLDGDVQRRLPCGQAGMGGER